MKKKVEFETLEFLDVGYSTANFKSEKETADEIIKIAQMVSKMGDKNGN